MQRLKSIIMVSDIIRKQISRYFTGQKEIVFSNKIPDKEVMYQKFSKIDSLGLYLHIPFCDKICPYCPYNKTLYNEDLAKNYIDALKKEIDIYVPLNGNKPITSFYIGGGTPTTLLNNGLEEILQYVHKYFNIQCGIHLESHPIHLTKDNLNKLESLGIKYLSIGIESLNDNQLKTLERPYSVEQVKNTILQASAKNFECVNVDYIFDLPGQTEQEIEFAANDLVELGVDQVATYPLFNFNYTKLGKEFHKKHNAIATMFRRRKLLKIFEDIFYNSDFYRSSVWAFTKKGVNKYCSVTVPIYLGLGASGSSYLKDTFYVNTFNVSEYIHALNKNHSPISLSIDLTKRMQKSAWLYWRVYETSFKKSDFQKRFDQSFDDQFGKLIWIWKKLGYLNNGKDTIILTSKGSYWIHAFEDYFSINYINKLWGISRQNAWPTKVTL